MKKKLLLILLSCSIALNCTSLTASATQNNINENASINSANSEFTFKDVSSEMKLLLEEQLESEKSPELSPVQAELVEASENYIQPRIAFSSGMAKAFNAAGFYYSPDFRAALVSFLNEARANKATDYFKTTSFAFRMPSESKASILANTSLKKRTDLFGTLHYVQANFDVSKYNGKYSIAVILEDTYDFAKSNYNSLTNIVNDIAYYEQELGKIKPYKIRIFAGRGNLLTPPFNVPIW